MNLPDKLTMISELLMRVKKDHLREIENYPDAEIDIDVAIGTIEYAAKHLQQKMRLK